MDESALQKDDFMKKFKYYKSNKPKPSLDQVLSVGNCDVNLVTKFIPNEIKEDTRTQLLGLQSLNKWQSYTFARHPGLIFIKNPFTNAGQRYWIRKCLEDYPKKPNRLNIDIDSNYENWWAECFKNAECDKHLLKKLRWATLGYHHNWDTKVYSESNKTQFPEDLAELSHVLAKYLGYENFRAEAAIVNYYHMNSTLSAHTDHSEVNLEAPLFSFRFPALIAVIIDSKMKRRADYILEKIKIDAKNHNRTEKENVVPSNSSIENDSHDTFASFGDHNVIIEDSREKQSNFSTNSSVIENSPDVSIPNYGPKLLFDTRMSEVQIMNNAETIIQEPGTSKQATVPREDSSGNSSSSSASSSRSSSTSSSSSSSSGTSHLRTVNNYYQSPINSRESDVDLSDDDPTYTVNRSRSNLSKNTLLSASSSSLSSNNNNNTSYVDTPPQSTRISRKRTRDPSKWKQNIAKSMRNSGKAYVSCMTKKEVPARCVKDACKCRLKCSDNINETNRHILFEKYWVIGNIDLQRCYIRSCMMEVSPKYKYTNAAKPRLPNNAFYFTVDSIRIRVCKTFFINTLGICDRQIRTVKKKTDPQNFISKDNRGKHVSRKPIDVNLIESIKGHINSIPRIESHYLRASTSREYISGEKTIMDLWKDFDKSQKEEEKLTCDYWLYYNIFNKEFNIGFFQPKKDRCDLCLDYELANFTRKIEIKEKYDDHLKEKDLCRQEKRLDRQNIDETNICAVYDLQAVMQCPTGETSAFFYKSKLNCLNFTIVELIKKSEEINKRKKSDEKKGDEIGAYDNVYSYFWDEVQGKRGANEIGSCILDYLQRLNEQNPNKILHITFYSDNCCGQNKNKYITSLYSYAVSIFKNIHTITHKYLVKGHTQNEGDNVHSLIEKEIKKNKMSGPIYAPYQYVTLIKSSRKNGKPFNIKELTYDFFIDLKKLQDKWGYNFNEDEYKHNVSWNNIRALKFCKAEPFVFYYKTSYTQNEFIMVNMRNKRKKMDRLDDITVTKAYSQRLELSERKKTDLRDLINKNLIPSYYADFYNSVL